MGDRRHHVRARDRDGARPTRGRGDAPARPRSGCGARSSSLRCARGETATATATAAAILRSKRCRTVSCSSTRTACAAQIGARADPGTAGVRARAEAERGLGDTEDLWAAGGFSTLLQPGESADVVAWAGDLDRRPPPAAEIVTSAQARAARVEAMARPTDEVDALLAWAADQFVVTTATGPTVVAGYPWFGAWSRDTMTSYEGLFLETGRAERGPRSCSPRARGTRVGGHARQHRRRRGARVQHGRRHAVVRARGRPARRADRRRRPGRRRSSAALDGDPRSPRLHGTRYGHPLRPGDGLLAAGRRRAGADVDGRRASTGSAVTPARRQGSGDQRALDRRAGHARALRADRVGGTGRWPRCASGGPTSAARLRQSPDGLGLYDVVDGPAGDDAADPAEPAAARLPPLRSPVGRPGRRRCAVAVCRDGC